MSGAEEILRERQRQIDVEGWSLEHDLQYTNEQLVWAAICYAAPIAVIRTDSMQADPWPWDDLWDKRDKHSRIKQLIISGALISAEIDRLLANEAALRKVREG